MKEKEGDMNCKHEWCFDNMIIATNPPIYHKICKKCGRVEHVEGNYFEARNEFDDIYKKFYEGCQK